MTLSDKVSPAPVHTMLDRASPSELLILLLGCLGACVNGVCQPFLCILFGDSVDSVGDPEGTSMLDLVPQMCYVGVAAFVGASFQGACFRLFAGMLANRIRILYLEAVLFKDVSWFDVRDVASIPTEMADDMEKIAEAFGDKLGTAVGGVASFVSSFIIAFVWGWQLALVTLGVVPLLVVGTILMAKSVQDVQYESQSWYAQAAAVVEESLYAMRTVVAMGGEKQELQAYTAALREARLGGVANHVETGLGGAFLMAVCTLFYALTLFYGETLLYDDVENSRTGAVWTGGEILIVFFCIFTGGFMLGQIEPGTKAFGAARVALGRFRYVVNSSSIVQCRKEDHRETLNSIDSFSLQDVHFSYPSRPYIPILKGLSLTIKGGQRTAVVGESGSGKSTIMSLLERFYDPIRGTVMVNGRDIRNFSVSSLRRHIGYVGQEPVLFATSVRTNIMQGSSQASETDLQDVLRTAQLSFLNELPDGVETFVGSGGSQFSGGQKQRIALARALIKNPSVLFLDEATSALDSTSEKIIQNTIESIGSVSSSGMTIVSIAHRLSTVQKSHVIYVLKEGMVVERGTHEELIAAKGLYCGLATSQGVTAALAATGTEVVDDVTSCGPVEADSDNIVKTASQVVNTQKKSNAQSEAKLGTPGEAAREMAIEKSYSVPMWRLLRYNRPEWPWFAPGLLACAATGASNPLMGFFLVNSLDAFYYTDQDKMRDEVRRVCLLFVGLAVVQFIGMLLSRACFGMLGETMSMRLRIEILTSIFRQEIGFHDDPLNTPALLGRALQLWAYRVTTLINQAGVYLSVLSSIACGLVIAFLGSWQMTLVMLGSIPILMAASAMQMVVMLGATSKESEQLQYAQQIVSESVQNSRTVQASGIERTLTDLYASMVKTAAQGVFNCALGGCAQGVAMSVHFFVMAGGFWYASVLVDNGNASFAGVMQAFLGVLYAGMGAGQALADLGNVTKAKVACHDMFALMDRKSLVNGLEPVGDMPMSNTDVGRITFDCVRFQYPFRPDVEILKGLCFEIKCGQSVALVGPSGGGKSTVMALIQRFYDPMEGAVRVGLSQVPLNELNIRWWRRQVGFVGQEPILFNTTILSNVTYGLGAEEVSDQHLSDCKAMAHMDFVDAEQGGWDTVVGPRGGRLSGGQKQRVAICRALVRNPRVLLLDEATSALDTASEGVVQQALEAARKGRTSVAIAHRLSTVVACDVILVCGDGIILERGTHAELMELGGVYHTLQNQARLCV